MSAKLNPTGPANTKMPGIVKPSQKSEAAKVKVTKPAPAPVNPPGK